MPQCGLCGPPAPDSYQQRLEYTDDGRNRYNTNMRELWEGNLWSFVVDILRCLRAGLGLV